MDTFSKEKRSEVMSKIRGKDTEIELLLRKALWERGLRYRKNPIKYFGKPDLVLKKYKTVIFLDSCFWHGCPTHYRIPLTNKKYWVGKIDGNIKRDEEVNKHYKNNGWKLLRFWEHDIKNNFNQVENLVWREVSKF